MLVIAFLVSILSIAVSIYTRWQANPQRMQGLGRNAAIGSRSSATMKSDAAWNVGHRAAWPKIKQASVVLLIGTLVSVGALPFISTTSGTALWGAIICVSYLAYLWLLLLGFKHAQRAANNPTASANDTAI